MNTNCEYQLYQLLMAINCYSWFLIFILRVKHQWLFMVINGYYYLYEWLLIPIGSMVLLYMVTWIPSIYPQCWHISYIPYMDPMGYMNGY